MTNAEALREAYGVCTECKLVDVCVEAECRWYHITKALEIADRLRQVNVRINATKHLDEMQKWERLIINEDSYFEGYKQAFRDIRGNIDEID